MSCHGEADPLRDGGAISPAIVAGLAGLDSARLGRWRAEGLLPASVINDDPDREEFGDPPWYYSWNEHHRVLGAAKLLELGLAETDLPDALARLDAACPQWAVTLPQRALEAALPKSVDLQRFWSERRHEGPLGRLFRFTDAVEMEGGKLGGLPNIGGRRIETDMVAGYHAGGMSIDEIAETYWLTPFQVRRAVEFQRALYAEAAADAPAAG